MKTIGQFLGKNVKGDIGLEIECEGEGMRIVEEGFWKTEDDGSLRGDYPSGRAEFILRQPILVGNVKKAVIQLKEILKGAEFDFSFRTSVHVHVNCNELTPHQCARFAYTYLLLEEMLVDKVGPERRNNRFCLRHQDAEGLEQAIKRMVDSGMFHELNPDFYKYAGVNVCPLTSYGSMEFRSMAGNMDVEAIDNWCNALINIRTFSLNFYEMRDIMEFVRVHGAEAFAKEALKDKFDYYAAPGFENGILRSASLTISLPHYFLPYEKADRLPQAAKDVKVKARARGEGPHVPAFWMAPPRMDELINGRVDRDEGPRIMFNPNGGFAVERAVRAAPLLDAFIPPEPENNDPLDF